MTTIPFLLLVDQSFNLLLQTNITVSRYRADTDDYWKRKQLFFKTDSLVPWATTMRTGPGGLEACSSSGPIITVPIEGLEYSGQKEKPPGLEHVNGTAWRDC